MLLKYSQYQRRSRPTAGSGKPHRVPGTRLVTGKGGHRRGMKGAPIKRLNNPHRTNNIASKRELDPPVATVDPCDNSNDSGLGFDHHLEYSLQRSNISPTFSDQEYWSSVEETGQSKKRRLDIKLETDDANDNFTFPCQQNLPISRSPSTECLVVGMQKSTVVTANSVTNCAATPGGGKSGGGKRGQTAGTGASTVWSRDGAVQLQILSQPEMQHRARYQTEGSRGAVKDRSGNGFPTVKLNGYEKSATLEVYIGTDQGKVAPHMFYQACRVSGKNSTPCIEHKVNGTIVIKIEFEPAKDMVITCDCVGILKERNVDVEHRFPEEGSSRSKKKSTRCRMVFRTIITRQDGTLETLQVISQPIVCTQPPGIPEISKKSLSSCECTGGLELFILGKNFLKDTKVMFCQGEPSTDNYWEHIVQPNKDYLQQSHLVCVIPPYRCDDIKEAVLVSLHVVSSGKSSEPHGFVYTPRGTPSLQALPQDLNSITQPVAPNLSRSTIQFTSPNLLLGAPLHMLTPEPAIPKVGQHTFIADDTTAKCNQESLLGWAESGVAGDMMPPPQSLPLPVRRITPAGDANREVHTTLSTFMTDTATLPSLSVDNYFSRIENKSAPEKSIFNVDRVQSTPGEAVPPSALMVVDTGRTLYNSVQEPTAPESSEASLTVAPPLLVNPTEESHPVLGFSPGKQIVSTAMVEFGGSTLLSEQNFPSNTSNGTGTFSAPPAPEFEASLMMSASGYSASEKGSGSDTTAFFGQEKHSLPPVPTTGSDFLMPPDFAAPTLLEPFATAQVLVVASAAQPPNTIVEDNKTSVLTKDVASVIVTSTPPTPSAMTHPEGPPKKCEEGIPLPQELTQMSEHDLLSYINPSCFDQV